MLRDMDFYNLQEIYLTNIKKYSIKQVNFCEKITL